MADQRPASPMLSYKYSTRGALVQGPWSWGLCHDRQEPRPFLPSPPAGAKIAALLTDSHASRNAYKMARALTSPERDVMHLITCVPSQEFK
jgi:hypothetical protein